MDSASDPMEMCPKSGMQKRMSEARYINWSQVWVDSCGGGWCTVTSVAWFPVIDVRGRGAVLCSYEVEWNDLLQALTLHNALCLVGCRARGITLWTIKRCTLR
eukprot:Gb_32506 [translate_table: standard]